MHATKVSVPEQIAANAYGGNKRIDPVINIWATKATSRSSQII